MSRSCLPVPIGNILLTGEASWFAETYSWSFATPNGKPANSDARIVGAQQEQPTLITDVAGAYRIQLVVSDGRTESEPAIVTIRSFEGFEERSFSADVVPILWDDCRSCHSVGLSYSIPGIPTLFDDLATLYSRAVSHINFDDIAQSPLVTRPAGKQHGGGERPRDGFDLSGGSANKDNYDTIIQWIYEGANNN